MGLLFRKLCLCLMKIEIYGNDLENSIAKKKLCWRYFQFVILCRLVLQCSVTFPSRPGDTLRTLQNQNPLDKAKMDSEYSALMAELGEGPPPSHHPPQRSNHHNPPPHMFGGNRPPFNINQPPPSLVSLFPALPNLLV